MPSRTGSAAQLVVDPRLDSAARGTPRRLFFTAAGGAVASLGAATGIAVRAKSAQDSELAKDPDFCDAGTRDAIRSQATTANILFVAGGLFGVGAAVLGFTTRWTTTEPGREARLEVAPALAAAEQESGPMATFEHAARFCGLLPLLVTGCTFAGLGDYEVLTCDYMRGPIRSSR